MITKQWNGKGVKMLNEETASGKATNIGKAEEKSNIQIH